MTSARIEKRPRVAIVGGGLAGLAAAVAAGERGMGVELFEQTKTLGGRAGSFADAEIGETVDYCQHVAMGCCTEFLDFCRRTGIDDCFEHVHALHFISPEGGQCDFTPSRWLPAPFNLLPGLLRLSYLSLSERWSIVRALHKLTRANNCRGTIGAWLRGQGQSDRSIERFWSVVLVSALGETVDRASLAAARKVFRDGFWASREASTLVLPHLPLAEIFHDRVGKWLADHDVTVHLGTPVRKIEGGGRRANAMVLADGARREFDFAVVAVPWRSVRSLFAENLLESMPSLADVERIEPAAITAIHLWFDRPITRLPHAVLVGRLSQWLFARACGAGVPPAKNCADRMSARDCAGGAPAPQCGSLAPQYCQVVVSASHRQPPRKPEQWLADVRREL